MQPVRRSHVPGLNARKHPGAGTAAPPCGRRCRFRDAHCRAFDI